MTDTDLTWHPASNLPTPGIPLIIELESGERIEGIRPNYVRDRNDDPDYRDMKSNRLQGVVRWAIK